MSPKSLHQIIKNNSRQDVYLCRECQQCNLVPSPEMDVPLSTILKMVMFDDDEVLTCRTLWSESVLEQSVRACKRGLNLHSILLALREEARQRGLVS